MTKEFHNKILKNVRKAHPNYSGARQEQEVNAVLATIGKNKRKGSSSKRKAGGKRKK